MRMAPWGPPQRETRDVPNTMENHIDAIKEAFLAKEWDLLDFLHLHDLLKYECESYLKKLLTSLQLKIIALIT